MGEPTGVQQNLGYTSTDDFITTTVNDLEFGTPTTPISSHAPRVIRT